MKAIPSEVAVPVENPLGERSGNSRDFAGTNHPATTVVRWVRRFINFCPPPPVGLLPLHRLAMAGIAAAAMTMLAGCAAVPVWRQELVSKPNMVFNDRGAFVYGPRLNAQIEPGSADNGGATAAGCTACK